MAQIQPSRAGAVLLLLASLVALALALYAYFTPLTGVTGSLGALVVTLASALLAVLSLLLMRPTGRAWRNVLRFVILLGLAGTGFAGLLLHQWWIAAAMIVGLVGLIVDISRAHAAPHPVQA